MHSLKSPSPPAQSPPTESTGMPKFPHATQRRHSVLNNQIRLMSRLRVRSLLFACCWLLLALFCLSVLWKLYCFLFLAHASWHQPSQHEVDWNLWTPAVNVFSQPTWAIRQLWPVYLAKGILPERGSTVFVFSSCSPFHDAIHLHDPRLVYEREQAQHLLLAVIQGLVNRIVWVYPYWLHHTARQELFHRRTTYRVGLATIELPPNHKPTPIRSQSGDRFTEPRSRPSVTWFTSPAPPDRVSDPHSVDQDSANLLNTICVCQENEHHCVLPFLFPLSFTVPTDACTRNASVLYEQVIDLLAESLVSPESTTKRTSAAPVTRQSLHWHEVIYGFRPPQSKLPAPWLANPDDPARPLSHVVLVDVNYFGTGSPVSREPRVDIRPAWISHKSNQSTHAHARPDVSHLSSSASLLNQFNSLLQPMFDELVSSFRTSSAPVNWTHVMQLAQLYVDSLFLLLPAEAHEPVVATRDWNVSTTASTATARCGRRSPGSVVAFLSPAEQLDRTRWHARLSSSLANSCESTELLALGLLTSVEPSVTPGDGVIRLWRWFCQLNRSKLLQLAQWTLCLADSDADRQSTDSERTTTVDNPVVHLCRRPARDHNAPHPLNKNETNLLLIRMHSILRNLATPRYMAFVNRSSTTPYVSFDPLETLCVYVNQLY